jgi:hypothetical protein
MQVKRDWFASDLALAVGLFCVITGSLVAVIWLLGWSSTDRNLTLMGGISGATTALIALVLRATEPSRDAKAIRSRRAAAILSYPAGFLAGGFSVLAAIALLGIMPQRASMPGAAMIGGLYGLVLGAYWAKAIETAAARDTLLAPTVAAVENRLLSSPRTNWTGKVLASARRVEGEIILGEVTVWFVPQVGGRRQKKSGTAELASSDNGKSLSEVSSTSLTIQDGKDGTNAEFLITISGGEEMPVFPRRQLAKVPTDAVSEMYQFKLLASNEVKSGGDGELSVGKVRPDESLVPIPIMVDAELNVAAAETAEAAGTVQAAEAVELKGRILRPILIDIAMAGRTVQVIETRLE